MSPWHLQITAESAGESSLEPKLSLNGFSVNLTVPAFISMCGLSLNPGVCTPPFPLQAPIKLKEGDRQQERNAEVKPV
eukprot:CAMPEP_0197630450 /NCGR_PEP_ID=MMETSP1338-20131121/7926_1 /TAXON_ID=43686 ORGANISM="Pelagodinium beii, Strain RCC1491" /NCGR_SAMPLE_ID=MMETSP1338 /ASSEMBLY_ACC=CAM_ASM_000754 /LENGTH=77 /DNA_ID=CAMNT_0043201663 /DNA_START=494 /DNA_END=724 /DNA_ORIENTATION=-